MPFDENFCAVGRDRQHALLFDFGPNRPELPTQARPTAPDENLAGAAKVEAWTKYENETAIYERARHDYTAAKCEYDSWHAAHPKEYPAKVTMTLVDSKEAVERGRGRYKFAFPEPAAAVEAA